MNWYYVTIGALAIIYVIQVFCVFKELSEGEYTKKRNVLIDLVPFFFIYGLLIDIIQFFYELCFENMVDEFKKLKW